MFDNIPDRAFLAAVVQIRTLGVYEWTLQERGWLEHGRYRILVNDDDDGQDTQTVLADRVRWGFVGSAPESDSESDVSGRPA